jgi:hypothetical protein
VLLFPCLLAAAVPNDAAYSQQTVEAACDRLVFLMKYVHHELFPDLVLRLSNKECFVDFGGSDPEARCDTLPGTTLLCNRLFCAALRSAARLLCDQPTQQGQAHRAALIMT